MKKNVVIIAVIVVIALVGFSILTFFDFQKSSTNMDSITVAYSPFESTALFWIAEDQGFFKDNGLNITMRKYDSGAASLDGVINGEADLTVGVTEFPLVKRHPRKRKFAQSEPSIKASSRILLHGRIGELRMFQTSRGKK